MNKQQLYTGTTLLFLGWMGVASLLTATIPLPEEMMNLLSKQFTPFQIKLLMLINPSIFVFIATIVGTVLYKKVNFSVPIIESFFNKTITPNYKDILKSGIFGGILAGILIAIVTFVFKPYFPKEFIELSESLQLGTLVKFLYGGITEEILIRFGLMSFMVWFLSIFVNKLNSAVYWLVIIITSIIFAVGHFPVVYNTIPKPPTVLLTYILVGNSIGGLIFGWLYYKKGLESAFIAHIFTHICMILSENLLQ